MYYPISSNTHTTRRPAQRDQTTANGQEAPARSQLEVINCSYNSTPCHNPAKPEKDLTTANGREAPARSQLESYTHPLLIQPDAQLKKRLDYHEWPGGASTKPA
ncbi:hypothetical protein PG990_008500 [Apiospora arundinis]